MGEYSDDDGSICADFRLIVKAVNAFSSEDLRKKTAIRVSTSLEPTQGKVVKCL